MASPRKEFNRQVVQDLQQLNIRIRNIEVFLGGLIAQSQKLNSEQNPTPQDVVSDNAANVTTATDEAA